MPTKRRRFMVNIPPALEPKVIARAKELNRSVANYLETLVADDLRGISVPEEQAPYGGGAEADKREAAKTLAAEEAKRAAKSGSGRAPRR